MTRKQKLGAIGVIIGVLLTMMSVFAITYFLTSLIYQRLDHSLPRSQPISLLRFPACYFAS